MTDDDGDIDFLALGAAVESLRGINPKSIDDPVLRARVVASKALDKAIRKREILLGRGKSVEKIEAEIRQHGERLLDLTRSPEISQKPS
jgi:hypothetical protein